jgi:twitching motility protein PilJ
MRWWVCWSFCWYSFENEQEWVRLSTDLQVQSQQLAKSASEAVEGSRSAFAELNDSRSMISGAIDSLMNGNSRKSLPSLPASLSAPLGDLNKTWSRVSTNAANILERKVLVQELAAASSEFMQAIPQIQTLTDSAVRDLTRCANSTGVCRGPPTRAVRPDAETSQGDASRRQRIG